VVKIKSVSFGGLGNGGYICVGKDAKDYPNSFAIATEAFNVCLIKTVYMEL
jgi:hypothetical protein